MTDSNIVRCRNCREALDYSLDLRCWVHKRHRLRSCDGYPRMEAAPEDHYQRVQDFIDSCSEVERRVAILRLCRMDNNGEEHFDHGVPGYSWCCLRCAGEGAGGLNGWVGALRMIGTLLPYGAEVDR